MTAAPLLAIVALGLPLLSAQDASTHPVTALEALHLVEAIEGGFRAASTERRFDDGVAVHAFAGTVGELAARAVVDAARARVLSIDVDGAPRYRFAGVRAVAHRGASAAAPENTLAAFREAVERGADAVEIDVRQTRDGVLVCLHDATLDRTTDGRGEVAERTAAEIRALDAGAWFDARFSGERVPTLREVFEMLGERCAPDLDFKAGDPERLVALVREFGLEDRATLWTGDPALGQAVVEREPRIRWRPTWRPDLESLLEWGRRAAGARIVNLDWRWVRASTIREIHGQGLLAFANTQGGPDTALARRLAVDAGADFVQTDHVADLVIELRQSGWKAGEVGRRVDVLPVLEQPDVDRVPRHRLDEGVVLTGLGPDAELSGLVASRAHPGVFWAVNDGGDRARVFAVQRDGTVVGARPGQPAAGIEVGGAINVDWESLTIDGSGRLIVADVGNNANTRRDLCLYYLLEPYPTAQRTAWFRRVWLRFPRQESFPAPRDDFDYDVEGIFALGDRIFVWSKNRSDRESDLYVLDDPGEGRVQDLRFVGAFRFDGSVTGADASADGTMAAVLTYAGIWVFDRFPTADRVLDGRVRYLPIQGAQLESVAFAGDGTLVLGAERTSTLHEIALEKLVVVREARSR